MTDINTTKHFVRISGKILGPFDVTQLRSLKDRGRLRPEHEVSLNRQNWMPASQLSGLFSEASAQKSPFTSEMVDQSQQPTQAVEWYYATGEEQQGPVSYKQLKKLVAQGLLTGDDLIWHSGLDEWIPVRNQPGLISKNSLRTVSARNKHGSGESAADSQTLLWSALLRQLREAMTVAQLRKFLNSLVSIGGGAMLIAIALIFVYSLTLAIRTNTIWPAITGIGMMLFASALRFAGLHSLQAGEDLIFTSPQQFSSLSFVKIIAVLLLTIGVIFSSFLFIGSIELAEVAEKIPLMMAASGLLFVFVIGASFILQPEGMNISLTRGSRAGNEGIAILSFVMKLLMRLNTFVFVSSAILACASYGSAAYLVAFERENPTLVGELILDPLLISLTSSGAISLITAGIAPLTAYVLFAMMSIVIDICQSVLQLPTSSSIVMAEQSRRLGDGSNDE